MYKLKLFPAKTAAIVLTVASLSMTGNVQAHHNDEYLSLVPFILYNVITQPRHHRSHQQKHHDHYDRPVRHNHNSDGYSKKRLIKKHRRH